jgi:hypothetical protein
MLAKVLAYLLRAWFVTCSEDEKMENALMDQNLLRNDKQPS